MKFNKTSSNNGRFPQFGAVAGAVSAFIFVIIHDIFISDIWFSLGMMLVAGAVCGLCVSWSYSRLVDVPSVRSWLGYNLLYVVSFVLLAVVSVIVFEPVTTVAALMQLSGPPDDLIGQVLPMTAVFTLSMALLISWLYGGDVPRFGAVLLTCAVLVLLLGLNVSVIGLVSFPSSSWYLVAEMLGLIVALNVVYVVVFIALAQKDFRGKMLSTSVMETGQDNNLEIE